MKKVSFPVYKKEWTPSLIPGPITLISTCNVKGTPNFAPKSWLQMVSFEPPILMFSGSKNNLTENNILKTKSFVVNIVDSSISEEVYNCIKWSGKDRIEKTNFSFSPSKKISAPIINECKAHIECKLLSTKEIGSGFIVFGEIVFISIWDEILKVKSEKCYELLDQIMFLENGMYSKIDYVETV
ncbi:MAG: flavin reductase family protein [bacterium]|nr:flavin reductase family protein [bacterium]